MSHKFLGIILLLVSSVSAYAEDGFVTSVDKPLKQGIVLFDQVVNKDVVNSDEAGELLLVRDLFDSATNTRNYVSFILVHKINASVDFQLIRAPPHHYV